MNPERAARTGLAADTDPSAVCQNDMFDYRKTEPGAAGFTAPHFVNLIEPFEQPREMSAFDSAPPILYRDDYLIAGGVADDLHFRSRIAALDRIVN